MSKTIYLKTSIFTLVFLLSSFLPPTEYFVEANCTLALSKIIKEPASQFHWVPKLYRRAESSIHALGVNNWAEKRYGKFAENITKALREIDKIHNRTEQNSVFELIADLGTMTRIDNFKAYVEKLPNSAAKSPSELRALFAESLGEVTVYRAVRLAEKEAAEILNQGLTPRKLPSSGTMMTPREHEKWVDNESLGSLMYHKTTVNWQFRSIDEKYNFNPLLSVTNDPQLAWAVAGLFGKSNLLSAVGLKRRDVYVYKIKVPEILLIRPSKYSKSAISDSDESFIFNEIPPQFFEKVERRRVNKGEASRYLEKLYPRTAFRDF
ncbi:MAG TPA: hypothetical protein DCS07_00115 [Bdellovibrionales bacterium]|nr:hypothetical protein [Bdellovibrionales bacterium]